MTENKRTKTATLLAVCLTALLALSACGYNAKKCFETVSKAFPEGIVSNIPGEKWKFLVRQPDNSVWFVATNNVVDVEISEKSRLW